MPRNGTPRPRQKVVSWETDVMVHSEAIETERADIGIVLQIAHAELDDGQSGFPRLSLAITRGDRGVLRLQCFEGDLSDIEALRQLVSDITDEVLQKGVAALRQAERRKKRDKTREKQEKQQRSQADASRSMIGKVGGGLQRFTPESKTARKRRKRERREGGE